MRDYLLDIVKNAHDLGCFDAIKVTGTDTITTFDAVTSDRNVVLYGQCHAPVPEFIGVFGMPNIDKLKIMLNLSEYRESAMITVQHQDRDGSGPQPVGLHFVNATGDFQNDYRFMTADIVAEQLRVAKPKRAPVWTMEFEPTQSAIQRLKMQAQAHSDEPLFRAATDRGDLKFSFGDHSTHAGEFVFQPGVTGDLTKVLHWPSRTVTAILDLVGDKIMRISDEGVTEITVDSGLITWRYSLLALIK
jgi:hypothetical protein